MAYNINDVVTLTATFTTVASGANTNPTSVTITVRPPNGTAQTPAVSNPQTGVFQASVTITQPGIWLWRATGTGTSAAQQDGLFVVAPNTF